MLRSITLWYTCMLMVALLAGSMDWKMQRNLESMSTSMQGALRLSLFDIMEQIEMHELKKAAKRDEELAGLYEDEANKMEEKSEKEHDFANQTRSRGDILAALAEMKEQKSNQLVDAAHHNEELRQKVLQNLTREELQHNQTLNKLRSVHEGLCRNTFIGKVCEAVGGVTGLQQQSRTEALRIQSDLHTASALEQKERLQEVVAKMMLDKSHKYNESATNLLHVADIWDEHAQKDYEAGQRANHTATALEHDVDVLDQAEKKVESNEARDELEIHNLLHTAQTNHVKAYWCAMVAIISSIGSLLFFLRMTAPRTAAFLEDCFEVSETTNPTEMEIEQLRSTRNASYFGLHAMFFFMALGMTGPYFLQIEQYPVAQRTVIVVWFAFLGTVFQSFFLHAIPRFLVEVRAVTPDIQGFALYLALKGLIVFFMFLMEVLFVWLCLGDAFFSPHIIDRFNSLLFCMFTVILSVIYCYYYDSHLPYNGTGTESVTVWEYSSEQASLLSNSQAAKSFQSGSISEVTPLNKEQILSPGTTIDLNHGRQGSTATPSPSRVPDAPLSVRDEFQRLVLPFEILVIASMVAVLRNCLHTVWNSQATFFQGSILVCACVLLIIAALLLKDLACEECCETSSSSPQKRNPRKRTNALELVQV